MRPSAVSATIIVVKGDGQLDVHQQKNAAAVFRGEVRKPPDVAQTCRSACIDEHKADLAGKGAALFVFAYP